MSVARREWLASPAVTQLRNQYASAKKRELDELLGKALVSSDPVIRGHAMAFVTWQQALKSLEVDSGAD